MPSEGGAVPQPSDYGTERVEGFSDGVMAVIITIMAFELKTPATASFASLQDRLPGLLVYVLSFSLVGIYWNNHHHLFKATRRINGAVMWANLHLLFWLSLIPFLTEWVASQHTHPLPAACYGFVNLAAATAYTILVRAIVRADKPGSVVAQAIGADLKGKVSLGLFAVAIPLSLLSPWISYALYVTVAVIWVIPDRRLSRFPRP
ncbi:MAG: TMEM175 family protein [Acidimicrobiales bacterium]